MTYWAGTGQANYERNRLNYGHLFKLNSDAEFVTFSDYNMHRQKRRSPEAAIMYTAIICCLLIFCARTLYNWYWFGTEAYF